MTLDELARAYPGATTTQFGDSPELSHRLLGLIRSGKKTATCSALQAYKIEGESLPIAGQHQIVLDWDGSPSLVIRIESVNLTRFCDVDEAFALSEGENEDLAGWRRDHQAFFERNGGFDPEMMLVCERIRLVDTVT